MKEKIDFKIDEKEVEKLQEEGVDALTDNVEITKEHLDLLKGKLPSKKIMRKFLRKKNQLFSQQINERFRLKRLKEKNESSR